MKSSVSKKRIPEFYLDYPSTRDDECMLNGTQVVADVKFRVDEFEAESEKRLGVEDKKNEATNTRLLH